MSDASPLLRITGLAKRFGGTAALDGADFTVAGGEVNALLGRTGRQIDPGRRSPSFTRNSGW